MADDQTRLVISIETILRNLDRTLAGLKKVEQQLKSVANVRVNTNAFAKSTAAATSAGRIQVDQARKTAREIERINAQTARQAAQQEAIRARTARTLAIIQQREARRGADAFLKSMKAQEAATGAFNARVQSLGNSLRSLGQGAASVGFGLTAGLSLPLLAFGKSALDAAVTIDSLKRGLTAIVGSADEAGKQLARLTEIAKLPGIGFEEAIQGSIRLQAVGFSAADAEKALIQFSNAVALTGGGREELSRITVQLGQLAAKGKVLSQDLRPIIEAAPAVGRALKQAFGTVNADDIADLTTNSREFLDTLVKELERLPRAAGGAKNTFENFRDAVFRASSAIGDALIPVLTRLIEVAEPIITKLANSFRQLPPVLQTVAVLLGAGTIAIGPLLIAVGLLTTGIGRLAVGLAQLSSLGLLPTIASLRAFNVAATATIARLLGLRAATIAAAGPWVALAAAIGAVAAVIALSGPDELTVATEDQLKSTKKLIDGYEDEIRLLDSLRGEVSATAAQQDRLQQIYKALGIQAELRIKSLSTEEERLAALRAELTKLLEAERERLRIQGASIAGKFAQDLQKLVDLEQERLDIERQLNIIERTDTGLIGDAKALTDRHTELNSELETQNELVRKGAQGLKIYEEVSGDSAEEAFRLSRTLGGMEGVTADVAERFKSLTVEVKDTTDAMKEFKRILDSVTVDFTDTDKIDKRFDNILKRIKETTHSTEDGVNALQNYIQLIPELSDVIERRRRGKTVKGFITDLFDEKQAADKGTALRNAQEALADAIDKLAQESKENQIAIEKSKNDELLRLNEARFSKELISFREFVSERARLQQAEIQGEIDRQRQLAETAAADAVRQQQRAGVTRGAEQVRARAAEQAALAKKVEAETKILDLQSRQKDIAADAANELREFNKDRLRDFRELSRELDEILGKEKAAGEAAIDERFRDTLRELNNEMKQAGQTLLEASDDAQRSLAAADVERISNQKTIIDNLKTQLKSVVALRAAQEDVNRAEERQSNLERDIAFQVEFRGLSEREAVNRRLEGEKLVRAEIERQQVALKEVILTLKRMGLEVPLGLLEGLERFKVAAKGLGESPFAEQFKLAEIDLARVADVLAEKIADTERAIRSRTISEVEGRIIIRRLNGEYVGELERQLEILKAIAVASGDDALLRQVRSAEQSVKDTRAAADELRNFQQQLESVAIDSFGDSLSQLFKDLRDNTESAAQDILNFFNNIANRVSDFIAENFAQRIAESLFPDAEGGGGLLASIKGLFGIGGGGQQAAVGASLTAASATLSTSVVSSATAFASIITAAGAAFAAAVSASSAFQGAAGFASGFGFAKGDIIPAAPQGRVIKVAEGGHAEAVITSDPRYAMKQAEILRRFLRMTHGLSGHFRGVPEFAAGGIITPREAEANLLASLPSRTSLAASIPTELAARGDSAPSLNFRNINLFDRRAMVKGYLRSAEGAQDILNVVSENADEFGRRIRIR